MNGSTPEQGASVRPQLERELIHRVQAEPTDRLSQSLYARLTGQLYEPPPIISSQDSTRRLWSYGFVRQAPLQALTFPVKFTGWLMSIP